MVLNEKGIKVEKKPVEKKETTVPDELMAALKKNKRAMEVWKAFSPGKIREYAAWVADAKSDVTKQKRIDTAVEWISEGKSRNWKYQTK